MSFNPLDIYARATRRLPLTPAERAALKTVDQLVLASIAGALVAVGQAALDGGAPLSFATLGHVFVYALAVALLTGLAKLFRASGDVAFAALANALNSAAARIPQTPQQPQQPAQAQVSGTGPATNMANTGPLAARMQRQAFLASGGGSFPPLRSVVNPVVNPVGPQTRPAQAVSAASSSVRQPQAQQMMDEPPEAPVPSQDVVAPPAVPTVPAEYAEDAGDENGPPTVQVAAVRVGSPAVATPTSSAAALDPRDPRDPRDVAPPPPAPPSEWLR